MKRGEVEERCQLRYRKRGCGSGADPVPHTETPTTTEAAKPTETRGCTFDRTDSTGGGPKAHYGPPVVSSNLLPCSPGTPICGIGTSYHTSNSLTTSVSDTASGSTTLTIGSAASIVQFAGTIGWEHTTGTDKSDESGFDTSYNLAVNPGRTAFAAFVPEFGCK